MRTANSPFKWMVEQGKEDGTLKRYTADGQLQQVAEFNEGVIDAANSKYIKSVPKADDVKVDPKQRRPQP
jgi:antitoxin component YwqK of YwqJK toxin-antitoxin module